MDLDSKEVRTKFFSDLRADEQPCDILDFHKGMRFIRGYNAYTVAVHRLKTSEEEKRMQKMRIREAEDQTPPDSPMVA